MKTVSELHGNTNTSYVRNTWLRMSQRIGVPRMLYRSLTAFHRRLTWLSHGLTARRAANVTVAAASYLAKRETASTTPIAVKIDISPLCNLRCTMCVHAHGNGNADLEGQHFNGRQKMTVDQFRRIIDQIKDTTSAVSLYYLGDPLIHPELDEMCRIADDAGLNSHVSTNYSFRLSDERIESIVSSGLSHLTICLDGMSQETYQRTRVGGSIDWVMSNLERTCTARDRLRQKLPRIEVQYLMYQHNEHEIEQANEICNRLGVDQFAAKWGDLGNLTDFLPQKYRIEGPKEPYRLPLCHWPYASTVIKFNGDVIPCCNYRAGEQYIPGRDYRVLGNVFEQDLQEIWNSEEYRSIRRLVSNPQEAAKEPGCDKSFCHGCPAVYNTNAESTRILGNEREYEDIYQIDLKGIPVRRPETLIQLTNVPDNPRPSDSAAA